MILWTPTLDYYWIKTYRNDTLFNAPSDINTCVDGTGGPVTSASHDTSSFRNQQSCLGLNLTGLTIPAKFEIHSITKNPISFSADLQSNKQCRSFATTPKYKTNFVSERCKNKAVGWFSMASVVSQKIVVKIIQAGGPKYLLVVSGL